MMIIDLVGFVEINILEIIFVILVTHLIHFIAISALYLNPLVARIYKAYEKYPGIKNWGSQGKYVINMFMFTFLEICFISVVFICTIQAMPVNIWLHGMVFGIIISAIRIYPRFVSMYMQTKYPAKLLFIEILNGTIGSLIIGISFSYFFSLNLM